MSLFPTTQWGAVVAAGRGERGRDPCALEALCGAYWSPLYVRARSLGHGADAARDLTQRIDEPTARERTYLAIRRFAKRQGTWFRAEPGIAWVGAQRAEQALARALALLEAPAAS